MLTIWRRHNLGIPGKPETGCPHKSKGRTWKRCDCPIWSDGTLGNKRVRKPLDTRSWQKGLEIIQEWQLNGAVKEVKLIGVTIEEAIESFLAELTAEARKPQTIANHKYFLGQFQNFCTHIGIHVVSQLSLDLTRRFRLSWNGAVQTSRTKLINLRTFYKFCMTNKWISENFAKTLKQPTAPEPNAEPFSSDDVSKILAECDTAIKNPKAFRHGITLDDALRLRTLILVMRYSGLRIGDAISLHVDQVTDGELHLNTAKTQSPISFPLPDFVIAALDQCPRMRPYHWFFNGSARLKSETDRYRRLLYQIADKVGIVDANPHRFRHTFSVGLLEAEVPLEQVSRLLGHRSIKTTQRHYARWTDRRKEQTMESLRMALRTDPVAIAQRNKIGNGALLRRVK